METEDLAFGAEIHALPNQREVREAVEKFRVDRADETTADPEQLF
jgi:two-component system chemotaxis sensor kinase CheA/chemotaxis protein CheC